MDGSEEGSMRIDAGELLAHAAWMRRLGAALAGAEGEDLAQEAWLAALARGPGRLERPRSWLGTVMRNLARAGARARARRRAREVRAARPEAEPSTDELAARAELEQLAVRAVLALEEPYREALLLRYVSGLEPGEIAARLALPPSTVRTRIARGLERVRRELDRRHGGERGAWLGLLASFENRSWPGAAAGAATQAAVLTGGVLVSGKWLAAGAAVVVAAVLWAVRSREEGEGELELAVPGGPVELQAPQVRSEDPIAEAEPETHARRTLRTPAPGAAGESTTSLTVRVLWGRDCSPVAGLSVVLTSWDAAYRVPRQGVTGEDGTVRFDGLEPESQLVEARGTIDFFDVPRGEARTVELVLPPGIDVDGRVVDSEGVGVGGASLWLSDYGNHSSGTIVGETDAAGRFFLRDVPADGARTLAARAAGFAPSPQHPIRGNPGARLEVTIALPGPGATLAGTVRDRDGPPIAGAELVLGPYPEQVQLANGELLPGSPPVVLRSDEEGRFAADGLAPGPLYIHARASGFAPTTAQAQLVAGETGRCEIALQPGARVAGVVRGAEGEPLAGVAVAGGEEPFRAVTRSQADGSFELDELWSGTVDVRASDGRHGEARTTLLVRSGEETRWDPVLAAGEKVAGTVLDERDRPLEHWQVAAVERHQTGLWLRDDRTDAAGRFELLNCPAKPFVLAVRSPEEVWGDPVLVFDDFAPGDEALLIRVRDADRPTAFLEGRVVAADGTALVQPQVIHQSAAGSGLACYPVESGRFRIGPLRPGEYALVVEAQGLGDLRAGPFALAPGETREVGTLVLEPPGRIRVQLAFMPPPDAGHLFSSLHAGGRFVDNLRYEDGVGLSGALGRGSYVLRTRSWRWAGPDQEVEVLPGRTTEVELALEPATHRSIELLLPDGSAASEVRVTVRDSAGLVVAEHRSTDMDFSQREPLRRGRFWTSVGGLLPGTYSLEARTSTGLLATGAFTVADLSPVEEPLVFVLR